MCMEHGDVLLRLTTMKTTAALIAAAVLLGACGSDSNGASPPRSPGVGTSEQRTIEIYSAVIRRLILKDNTFGGGSSPFDHLFIVDGATPDAGDPMDEAKPPPEPFAEEVKRGIEEALADLPPIDFVADPDDVRLGPNGLDGVKDNGVILTMAPIDGDGHKVEVPNAMWCGGLCGQWLTYVVELEDGDWKVTGQTGPHAIS